MASLIVYLFYIYFVILLGLDGEVPTTQILRAIDPPAGPGRNRVLTDDEIREGALIAWNLEHQPWHEDIMGPAGVTPAALVSIPVGDVPAVPVDAAARGGRGAGPGPRARGGARGRPRRPAVAPGVMADPDDPAPDAAAARGAGRGGRGRKRARDA